MFGYIMADENALDKPARRRYGMYYCGLCRALSAKFGSPGCATLTYDMTFLSILLSSVYELPEMEDSRRCVPRPIKPRPFVTTGAADYAADMNLILAYYQCLDDWRDDGNHIAHKRSRQLETHLGGIRQRWPRQCLSIEQSLSTLEGLERAGELNPDLPANCFGELLGHVFAWELDEHAKDLYMMGAALGRYIYLLDAVNDLHADLKKERYNPLTAQIDTDFTPILTMMMAECTAAFERLPVHRDGDILQNVLYSGVWQKYRNRSMEARKH